MSIKDKYSPITSHKTAPSEVITDNNKHWGNKMSIKPDSCFCIVMENINNIQATKKGNLKLNQGKAWLIENKVDLACWIELGVPWH